MFEMYKALYDEHAKQHNLLNHIQGELQRKRQEANLRDVLEALLPIVASILGAARELDESNLATFVERKVPMWYEGVEYALSRYGISLIRHLPGEDAPDYDESLEIRGSETGDKSLDGKVKKSVEWGYSIDGETHREVIYVWMYNPELDTSDCQEGVAETIEAEKSESDAVKGENSSPTEDTE